MGKFIDLTGRTFGRLTVIGQAGYSFKPCGQKEHQWLCRCSCGDTEPIIVRGSNLRKGITKSCGCSANRRRYSDHKLVDLTGRKFGKLTVIEQTNHYITKSGKKKVMWLCQCECGRKRSVKAADLSSGNTQSCGKCKCENRYEVKDDYVIGYTNTGDSFIIDKDDFEHVKPFYWSKAKGRCPYIETFKGGKRMLLHRFIIGARKGDIVDHINHDESDSRKQNIRIVTAMENSINRKIRADNTSGYPGVMQRYNGKWYAEIKVNHKRISLGTFAEKEDAIAARKAAEERYFGEYSYSKSISAVPKIEQPNPPERVKSIFGGINETCINPRPFSKQPPVFASPRPAHLNGYPV